MRRGRDSRLECERTNGTMPGEGIALNVQMVLLVHEIVGRNATREVLMIDTLVVIPSLLVGDTSIRILELLFKRT